MKAIDSPLTRMNGTPVRAAWRRALALLSLSLALLLAGYWPTAMSMVDIWRHSATFAHGMVVVPIVLWLVWRERKSLAMLAPEPQPLALTLLVLAGIGWLLGDLASVNSPSQFALVLMIQLTVWGILGTRVVRRLAFPLAFLFFAVPVGEFMLPWLMGRTADFTIHALRATGIPVYREGLDFVIPSGSWSVVEACSGIRYLIASLMVGVLYAYLTYRSLTRRLLFVAAALLVPLVANWVRAYMIVMIGHLTDNAYATGIDHLIYGWVFFGIVTLALFWVGSFWQQAPAARPVPFDEDARGCVSASRFALVAAAALALALPWRPLAAKLNGWNADSPVGLTPIAGRNGWESKAGVPGTWRPVFRGAAARLEQTFRKNGAEVGMVVAYYRGQTQGSELVSSENGLVAPQDGHAWKQTARGTRVVGAGSPGIVRIADLRGVRARLRAWEWYWIAGRATVDPIEAKLFQARSKLLLKGDDSAAVVLFVATEEPAQADVVLGRFVADMGDALDLALARAAVGSTD